MLGRRTAASSLSLLLAGSFLAACGGDTEAPPERPQELQRVTLSTDFFFNPGYAPILLAADKGYFEEEGLDVTVRQGNPGGGNLQAVSEGTVDFLYGAVDEVPFAVASGADVKAVAVFTHSNPNSIVVKADSLIQGIEDLAGATIGQPVGGGPPYAMFPDILESVGVDPATVEVVDVDFESLGPSLLSGQVEAINMWYTVTPLVEQGGPVRYYPYKDYGFDFLGGLALMTSSRMIEDNPDAVRGMVSALLRAWADSARDPAGTIEAGARSEYRESFLDAEPLIEYLELTLTNLETPDTEQNGLGLSTDAEWQSLVDVSQQYGGLEEVFSLDTYYTNEFLPEEPILP